MTMMWDATNSELPIDASEALMEVVIDSRLKAEFFQSNSAKSDTIRDEVVFAAEFPQFISMDSTAQVYARKTKDDMKKTAELVFTYPFYALTAN